MTDAIDPADLQALLDDGAIRRVLATYCRAVDRCDKELLRTVFHPDAIEHHGTFEGNAIDFVDYVVDVAQPRYDRSVHYVLNSLIDIDGDVARSETYIVGVQIRVEDDGEYNDMIGGRFLDRFERRDGEWRIAERTLVRDFDDTVRLEGPEKWASLFPQARRDRDDLVYGL